MAIKNDENLSQFGQKLLELMGEQDCDTPKALEKSCSKQNLFLLIQEEKTYIKIKIMRLEA